MDGYTKNVRYGRIIFNKEWKDFEDGFGDIRGDQLWYGLKALSCFTETGQWELRIDFQFLNKTWSYLHYKQFKVGNTSAEYPLTIGGFSGITPTDPFATHNLSGVKFSTFDNDNDHILKDNCAGEIGSAWWYRSCYHINLNRRSPYVYLNSKWYHLLHAEMKIRQRDCVIQ